MDADLSLSVVDQPDPAALDAIRAGLDAHARDEGLAADAEPLAVVLRREQVVVGGVHGATHWGWLHVRHLWVDASLRRQGHGRRLLATAEAVAAGRGCRAVWLDTFSFQAPDFYLGLGYRPFGRLEDYPPGHARLFVWKPVGVSPP